MADLEESQRNLFRSPKHSVERYEKLHRDFGPSDFEKRRMSNTTTPGGQKQGGKKVMKTSPKRTAIVQPIQESPFHRSYQGSKF
mmetsp:Transcript_37515/g.49326  ORF Transcript_37515/g.49326 Transcript_37515/m.49326 type:complete len:84 (+) Transcript_37515:72-323(+)